MDMNAVATIASGRACASLLVAGLTAALFLAQLGPVAAAPEPPRRTADGAYVVWAVGDVCDNDDAPLDCADVAALITADGQRDAFLVLGDAQYLDGTLAEYQRWYQTKMGALNSITYPAPGNHDYNTTNAAGYFDYWGARAGTRGQGWYGFTLGAWRIVAANSNCGRVGGCAGGTTQGAFVRSQLQTAGTCELVFAHHPAFSDGPHGDTSEGRALFTIAYNNHAEVYLSGHDHSYQRFAPRRSDGTVDNSAGVRSFVVGTGGSDLTSLKATNRSQYRQVSAFGALRLVLSTTGYTATYYRIDGAVLDSTSGTCRA